MTRATRIALPLAGFLLATFPAAELTAQNPATPSRYAPQNPQPGVAGAGPAQPQQPARASVYGPAVGPAAQPAQPQGAQPPQRQPYPAAGTVQNTQLQGSAQQPGAVRPASGQEPIRQPGLGNPGLGNVNAPGAGGPLDVPRAAVVPPAPVQPEGFPLDPKVQAWVDQVLLYWEKRSDQVKTLECTFQKWEYDPQSTPDEFNRLKNLNKLHEMRAFKYAGGEIKYAGPDKGLFHVRRLMSLAPDKKTGELNYADQPPENGEHWITDGKRVFAFDAVKKQVIESQLPPEMQGKSLADGPLPFMFGARAETIKARYWIRPLQADKPGEYNLEAIPKSRQDAGNFKMVHVVLDEKEYLPIRMQIFDTDWSPANPHRTAYMFENRKVNNPDLVKVLNPLGLPNPWASEFYDVKTPRGWTRVVVGPDGKVVPPAGAAGASTATAPNVQGPVPR